MDADEPIFTDVARGGKWFWAIPALVVAAVVVITVLAIIYGGSSDGENMAAIAITSLSLTVVCVVMYAFSRLKTEVYTDRLRFGFGPFGKTVPYDMLAKIEVVDRGWEHIGGGIHYSLGGRVDYTLSGMRMGVLATVSNAKRSYLFTPSDPRAVIAAVRRFYKRPAGTSRGR